MLNTSVSLERNYFMIKWYSVMRCEERHEKTSTPSGTGIRRAGLVLVVAAFVLLFCGCAGEDRYVEIIVAHTDTVITPVPAAMTKAADGLQGSAEQQISPEYEATGSNTRKDSGSVADTAAKATPQPTVTPTPLPTVSPTPELTPTPVPTVSPVLTPKPTPSYTPEPAANNDGLMQQELNVLYADYMDEIDRLRKRYESEIDGIRNSIEYMGEPVDDPEYIEQRTALEKELAAIEAELSAQEQALEKEYNEKTSNVYKKYGK